MWLSFNILSSMVDLTGVDPVDLGRRLTMSTAEIESIDYMNAHLKTVISARITDMKPHPNADKLSLLEVDTGSASLPIVCGAPNHKKGDIVALATVGTVFPGGFTISKSKIRGQESQGMLCSERELGLSDEHSGIMILPPDTPLGTPLSKLFPDWVDIRLEIDNKSITHRPDLWSHTGFAREIGAILGRPVKDIIKWDLEKECAGGDGITVTIKSPEASPRYSGLVVKGITIAESPSWLKAMVTAIGMRPINNIVDITNFVMAEVGEPMHAFDRSKLHGGEIIVRLASQGEPIMTLDGQTFELCSEDVVIADAAGPVALAGVMGGGNSEIEDSTSMIVLEAANFNPVNIRKTAARYTQRTEAAIRFEKALSPELTKAALLRCYDLIKQIIPGAHASSPIVDGYPVPMKPVSIEITTDHIRKRLGENIDDARILSILESLDFRITRKGNQLTIGVPHYRATKDITIPEDVVEEVGRIYGYDNITPVPPMVACAAPQKNHFRLFERSVKRILSGHFNLIETSGYSFVGEDMLNRMGMNEDRELRLANPLSSEMDRLRRSVVPNVVKNVADNQRYHDEFGIYELGRVYLKDDRKSRDLIAERTMVAGGVFAKKGDDPLFYRAKNIVRGLADRLEIAGFELVPAASDIPSWAHPVRAAALMAGGVRAGIVAEIHPDIADRFEIRGAAALFDIDCTALFGAPRREMTFRDLQRFPEVPFEISVLADERTYSSELCAIIEKTSNLVRQTGIVSVYTGAPIPEGKKSVSIRTIFSSQEKTLSPEEVQSLQQGVIAALTKKGFQLR